MSLFAAGDHPASDPLVAASLFATPWQSNPSNARTKHLHSIIVAAGVLFLLMAAPVPWLPAAPAAVGATSVYAGVLVLIAIPTFRRVLPIAALVIGSHAMSDAFAVIHWRAEGIASTAIGVLWSEAVASEIVVFAFLGPYALRHLGPGLCAAFAAAAGLLRWTILAFMDKIPAFVAAQLFHGLTFAMLHLACMQIIRTVVPDALSATAQTLYGTLSLGITSAVITLLSGKLYVQLALTGLWPWPRSVLSHSYGRGSR